MKTNPRLAAAVAALALGAGGLAAAAMAPAHALGVPAANGTWTCTATDASTPIGQLLQGTSVQLGMSFDTHVLDTQVTPGSQLQSFSLPATMPLGGYVSELANAGVQSMGLSIASFPLTIDAPTPQTVATSLVGPQTTLDRLTDPGLQLASALTGGPVPVPSAAGSYAVSAPDAFTADISLVDPTLTGGSTAPFAAGSLACTAGSGLTLGTLDDGVAGTPPPSSSPTPTPSPTTGPTSTPTPGQSETWVNVSLDSSTIAAGKSARVTASVLSGAGPVSGQVVALVDGSKWAGPADLHHGTATLQLRGLATGTHSITVAYLGAPTYATSTSTAHQLTVVAK